MKYVNTSKHTGWCLPCGRFSIKVGSLAQCHRTMPVSTQLTGTNINVSTGKDCLFQEFKHLPKTCGIISNQQLGKYYGGILTTILDNFSLVFKQVLVNLKYPERASRRLRRTPGTAFWVGCHPAGTRRYTERSELLILRATVMTHSTHPGQDS